MDSDIIIESIEEDSRVVANNYLFCAVKGLTVDGHDYINQAIKNGAVAVLTSKDVDADVPLIKVANTSLAMGKALSKFYNEPDKHLKLIGITGTDGKTTLTSIIYQLINRIDKCGYIGTNGVECHAFNETLNYTTPFPKELYKYLSQFYEAKCNYVSIETSSEGFLTNRLSALEFIISIFTNISAEHLDKHKTMENYVESKGQLFKQTKKEGYSIINNDDDYSEKIKQFSNGRIITYGINKESDIMASNIIVGENKLLFKLKLFDDYYDIVSLLSGMFNVYNLMASIGACYLLGFDIKDLIEGVKELKPIKARINFLNYNQPYKIILDYAHTANAVKNLLEYANVIARGRIITVLGAAGGRDPIKRPLMGEIATKLSDYVIFTMDDPREEDPNDIIDDMVKNIKNNRLNYERIVDRGKAIHKALDLATKDDVIVVTGKGSDNYMAVGKDYIRYSDIEEIEKYFNQSK
ncbi:MAG: UDP-N-acetylmuramoyl-L-alanyl-D-glutamate--2,6-diaminopimelate ligase [Bacilli bacterium]|nr:UDP-N-acetylmuramoyl-L-alanyl-D-glutamate--2,6-diaminopimelate ligase [Bacilli bacterium]